MAWVWDGSAGFDQIIQVAAGALSTVDGGPITVAVLVRPSTGAACGILQGRTAAGNPVWSLLREPDGKWYVDGDFTGFDASAADGIWQLIGYTKDSGSAQVRWHLWRADTGAWTHTGGSTVGDGTGPVDHVWLGRAYNRHDGDIAVAAVWAEILTDDQIETLPHTLTAWQALNPTAGWLLDGADVAQLVADWTGGGANETSRPGMDPAVSTASVPGLSYGHPILTPHTSAAAAPSTVDLTPAALTFTAVPLTPTPGPVTAALTPATVTVTAVAVTPTPGPVTVALTPATLTITAVPLTQPAPQPAAHVAVEATTTAAGGLDTTTTAAGMLD